MRLRNWIALVAPAGALVACGVSDVQSSTEYVALSAERDALVVEIDEALAELDAANAELDDVDDRLAIAEGRLSGVGAQSEAAASIAADLDAFLVLDVMNRVGVDRTVAECVSEAFVGDARDRQAYLLLLDPDRTDAGEIQAAYDEVMPVLEDCGLEVPDTDARATIPAELTELLGEVVAEGTALPTFVSEDADPAVGTLAPVLIGEDYDGHEVRIDAAVDGPTMVIVVAHWCPHCNAEIPRLNQLRDEGRIPDGVGVVAISSAVRSDAPNFPPDRWLDDIDWTFPVIADGVDPDSGRFVGYDVFGVSGVPFVTLVDGDGIVVQRWAGERDIDAVAAALAGLAAGG